MITLFRRLRIKAFILVFIALSALPISASANPDIIVYEDGSDGNTAPWFIYPSGTTSVIENTVDNDPAHDRVMSLTASTPSARMVFYAQPSQPWAYPAYPVLQWDIKYSGRANVLVMLKTDNVALNNGYQYLSYATNNTPGARGNTYYFKLDSIFADGTWRTITRNLQQDMSAYAPNTKILGK